MRNSLYIILLILLAILSCQKDHTPLPEVGIVMVPVIGDTSLYFEFEAVGDHQFMQNRGIYSYQWDYDGDQQWDHTGRDCGINLFKFSEPGSYHITLKIKDGSGQFKLTGLNVRILGENTDINTLVDPRDGQSYRIVKLADSWWMAENLRYGVSIDYRIVQTNNGITEMHQCGENPIGIDPVGGVYNWLEAMNYNLDDITGICPPGWHIPNDTDWNRLLDSFSSMTSEQYKDYLSGKLSGINLDNGINYHLPTKFFTSEKWGYFNTMDVFWSSSWHRNQGSLAGHFVFALSGKYSHQIEKNLPTVHQTVRCIKN